MTRRKALRVVSFFALIALICAARPRDASADQTVYAVGSGNEFGTISLSTGAFTQIGTLALPSSDQIWGMGFGADGNLYGMDSLNAALYRISTTDASVTNLGNIGLGEIGVGSDASGKFYGLTSSFNSTLFTFNAPSPATVQVGPIGFQSYGLTAVTPDGSVMYTDYGNNFGTNSLARVDTATGATTRIGNIGHLVDTGLFVGGTLYGFAYLPDEIISINTATGAGTVVTTYSLPGGDGILAVATPSVVPEPSSLVLGSLGIAIVIGRVRFRIGRVRFRSKRGRGSRSCLSCDRAP
jgi:hypothetical protein